MDLATAKRLCEDPKSALWTGTLTTLSLQIVDLTPSAASSDTATPKVPERRRVAGNFRLPAHVCFSVQAVLLLAE